MSKVHKRKLLAIPISSETDVKKINGDFQLICKTHTGDAFDEIIIACVRRTDGYTNNVLFTSAKQNVAIKVFRAHFASSDL